jgi:hypothetical protein
MARAFAPGGAMTRAADFVWVRLPDAVGRLSALLGVVLRDGAYLRAWPPVAVAGPVAALLLGGVLGRIHPEQTFTGALWVMGPMVVVAGVGTALGLWTWLGYVLVDFFLFPHLVGLGDGALPARAGLLPTYLLLAMLLVVIPQTVRSLVRASTPRARSLSWLRKAMEVGLSCVLYAALVYVWTQGAPILVRPAYTWAGYTPTSEAIQPVQATGWFLVFLAALTGAARPVLQLAAVRRTPAGGAQAAPARRPRASSAASLGGSALQAAFTVVLLAGALEGWLDALVAWVVLTAILVGRRLLSGRIGGYVALAAQVPILARVVAAAAISFLLSRTILDLTFTATPSFRPVVLAAVLSLVVFTVLLPERIGPPVARPPRRVIR